MNNNTKTYLCDMAERYAVRRIDCKGENINLFYKGDPITVVPGVKELIFSIEDTVALGKTQMFSFRTESGGIVSYTYEDDEKAPESTYFVSDIGQHMLNVYGPATLPILDNRVITLSKEIEYIPAKHQFVVPIRNLTIKEVLDNRVLYSSSISLGSLSIKSVSILKVKSYQPKDRTFIITLDQFYKASSSDDTDMIIELDGSTTLTYKYKADNCRTPQVYIVVDDENGKCEIVFDSME